MTNKKMGNIIKIQLQILPDRVSCNLNFFISFSVIINFEYNGTRLSGRRVRCVSSGMARRLPFQFHNSNYISEHHPSQDCLLNGMP